MILPQVISALVSIFDNATSATVYDGPVPPAANKTDFVLVGSSAEEGEDGATVTQDLSDLGPGTWLAEGGEVICSFWSWSGGTDIAARRTAAAASATACADAVAADRSLGGLLTEPGIAQVSDFRYHAEQRAEGALCRFTFSVLYSHLHT